MTGIQHHPIPIDERLAHLDKEQYSELFNAYHFSAIQVSELFKKFDIEYKYIGGLRYILKHKEALGNSCPKHNVYYWQNAKGRNKWGDPYCPVCSEKAWTVLPPGYLERKRQALIDNPKRENKPRFDEVILTLEKYQSLDFSMKAVIMCWNKLNKEKKSPYLSFRLFHRSKVFPTDYMTIEFMQNLEKHELIHGNRLFVERILLEEELREYFNIGEYLFEAGPSSYLSFWEELAYQEVLEYLLYELNKKNITIQIDIEIKHVLQYMISNLPVQQCMFAIWAAMKDACSLIAEKNWDIEYAVKVIPEQLKKKSDRIIEGSLKYFPFTRAYHCRESKLANVFYNDIAKLGEFGFTVTPNIEIFYGDYHDERWLNDFDDWDQTPNEVQDHARNNDADSNNGPF